MVQLVALSQNTDASIQARAITYGKLLELKAFIESKAKSTSGDEKAFHQFALFQLNDF